MNENTLPYFGQIEIDNLNEYYDENININGINIELELNFEQEKIDTLNFEKLNFFIQNIDKFDTINKTHIIKEIDKKESVVNFYLNHQLSILALDKLSQIVNTNTNKDEIKKQLIDKFELQRIAIYPDGEFNFAVFDYSIGKNITNYLLVIETDDKGQIDLITMES